MAASGSAPERPAKPGERPGPDATGSLVVLKRREDFLRAARARRANAPAFGLQARRRDAGEPGPGRIRVGFTCSRKVGNAVARNRAKRRLREVARLELLNHGSDGWDYVLIGRRDSTAARPFDELRTDLKRALRKIQESDRP